MIGHVLRYNVICSFVAQLKSIWCSVRVAWISSDYFESSLLPQLREENDSKHSDEIQASVRVIGVNFIKFLIKGYEI